MAWQESRLRDYAEDPVLEGLLKELGLEDAELTGTRVARRSAVAEDDVEFEVSDVRTRATTRRTHAGPRR